MEALKTAFVQRDLEIPENLIVLLQEYGDSRKAVYRRIYGILKYGSRLGGARRMFVYPDELRSVVRERFVEPLPQAAHDADDRPNAYLVTIEDLAAARWPTKKM